MKFIDAILLPHVCYYRAVKKLFGDRGLHGLAHITGAGIEGNLSRILPKSVDANIDLGKIKILPIFKTIRAAGNIADAEMMMTYNMGVGLTVVADKKSALRIREHIRKQGHECYPIGEIAKGSGKVKFGGKLKWSA